MNEEFSPFERVVQFLYAIGLPPQRLLGLLIALLVITVVFGGIWFFTQDDGSRRTKRDEESLEVETVVEDTTVELSFDQEIDEMFYFDPDANGYVVLAGEFLKQTEKIKELRQRSGISDKQKQKLSQIELRNSRVLVERELFGKINADASQESFQALAESLVNGQDEVIKDLAAFSIVKVALVKLYHFTTKPNGEEAIATLKQHKAAFINDRRRVGTLLDELMKTKRENPDKAIVGECIYEFGKILVSSSNEEVKKSGATIGQFSLLQDLDIVTLEDRIRFQGPNALADLDKSLRALEANPDVELSVWQFVMRGYEASLSTGNTGHFETATNIIGDLINKLSDADPRKAVLAKRLKLQVQRSKKIGTKHEINGMSVRDRKLVAGDDFTLLVFASRNQKSVDLMGELMQNGTDSGGSFRPIIVFRDPFTDDDMTRLNTIPRWAFIASGETAKQYIDEFSIDEFPYTFLIDKRGTVKEANLSMSQARNRIASVLQREREAESIKSGAK